MSFDKKDNEEPDLNAVNPAGTPVICVRLPKKWTKEQFALAGTILGANHFRVRFINGITSLGRINGEMKKLSLIREADTLL